MRQDMMESRMNGKRPKGRTTMRMMDMNRKERTYKWANEEECS